MGSPKSKPTATRPKARPKVSSSSRLFDAFNHPLAYSLGLHLLAPDSIIDYACPELKACVMSALPVLRYLKRNIDLHDLSVEARVFYGGINRIMERLHTIPQEWYDLCVDEDIYPSDAASLIKVIPPLRTKISLGPGDHRPLGKTFANYDQTDPTPAQIHTFLSNLPAIPPRSPSPAPEPEAEPGPVASSSRLIAHVTVPAGPTKKHPRELEDNDSAVSDAGAPSDDPAPISCFSLQSSKTDEGSPETARPSKRKKSKGKAKEEVASNKIPDAPHRRNRSPGAKAASRSDKDPDATKISKLIAARVQQAKDAKAGTPVQLNVDLDGDNYNLGDPDDIYLYLVRKKAQLAPDRFFTGYPTTTAYRQLDSDIYVNRFESLELIDVQKILEVDIKDTLIPEEPCMFSILHRVECVPIAFGHGCLNCFLKGFRFCCHTATMSELIKFHTEFAERFAEASHTTGIIVDQFQHTATRLASITALYNNASIDFAEAFDHLVRHFNDCVEKFGDETFATRFSDSSLAVRTHLADLVAQFQGTFKSFKNLDMSDVDFGKPPRPLSTARALINIARDTSESVEAVDADANSEEEVEEEEEEESRLATPPKMASKPSSRTSTAKPSSTPKKPASKPSPARPPTTRSRAVPKDKE
ncbi:hypothetical protein DFH07DRAFT_961230 [Mycena maculata]|uniref:Uncharacterized protein n=1 Tax=Mycena maculata TaxID=230809 RepID=A0AAD7N951_9AGAR|nr:hypothetical protein DFH07DRAFT_961230 [Mycena maculata]